MHALLPILKGTEKESTLMQQPCVRNCATKKLLIVIIALLAVVIISGYTKAQGITVSPMRVEVSLAAGESTTKAIEIINLAQEKRTVRITKVDFDIRANGTVSVWESNTTSDSLAKWFELPMEEIVLEAGEKKRIVLTISRPKDSPSLPHWGALLLTTSRPIGPQSREEGSSMSLQLSFIVGILQNPPTLTAKEGHVTSVDVEVTLNAKREDPEPQSGNSESEKLEHAQSSYVSISVTFVNVCNAILKTDVRLEVRNQEGEVIVEQLTRDKVMLPAHERTFTANFIIDNWEPGQYLALAIVDYGGETLTGGQWPFEIVEEE